MPLWALYFLILTHIALLSGCSAWPTTEHRAVTNDSVRAAMQSVVDIRSPVSCEGMERLDDNLQKQKATLDRIDLQLQSLSKTTPAFAMTDCPEQAVTPKTLDGKTIIGASEWIYLSPPGHHYQARVDSGASTSSLSAVNITRFERNGKRWVRFWLQHDDEANPVEVEAPLVRHVRIRQASSDEVDRRPVVSLTVNLGNDLQQDTEFSLTDRSQMTYPILLGRTFLRDVTLIDVGQRFLQPKFVPDKAPAQPAEALGGGQDDSKKQQTDTNVQQDTATQMKAGKNTSPSSPTSVPE